MIFLSYTKMHFSYVKSNILHRWLNILHNYVHTRTLFTPKIHPPLITQPATWPGQPPDPASHLTLLATDLAHHPTLPATPPCPPPHPACDPTLPALSALATTASWLLWRASAALVVLRRLYVWGEGHLMIYIPYLISYVPCPIFYIPRLIFIFYILHLIFYVPHLLFYIPHLIFYVPYLIFYTPYPIFYVTLTCDAATVDIWSARPLPPGVVNCPCVTLAFPCPVELGASQVSVHSSAPEM